ncbi:MAG: GntR family transcriptional regulator [Rhodobacter sp.]|nr:GntR family transcriptional regulator [Rhodobacter sp.]
MQMPHSSGEQLHATAASTAPERVYRDLRARIISFDLPPGTTLGRIELADRYGVSQTPVREALQRLEMDGLILIFPQSKTVVARIDVRQLSETQFLRVSIETEVVRRLATAQRPDVIKRAQAILEMQRTLTASGDEVSMFTELDRSFHLTLFKGVGMESLNAMLLDRLGHLYRCQRLELPRKGKMQNIVDAHQAILDGLAAGDPELASAAMREHLSGTISQIEMLRDEYPDFFTRDELR